MWPDDDYAVHDFIPADPRFGVTPGMLVFLMGVVLAVPFVWLVF